MNKLLPALALAALVAACAPAPAPGGVSGGGAAFDVDDFAWSARAGDNAIVGHVDYRFEGQQWRCAGAVGLTPDTPYTRRRFSVLYGSTRSAALPAAVVRARTVQEAGADYRSFVRDTQCDAQDRFRFDDLPDGGWFVIAPVRAEGQEPVVLMQRVTTRGGRATAVTLN